VRKSESVQRGFRFGRLRFVISDFGTATRRRVSSVIFSSGVLGLGFGVNVASSGPEADVCG